MNDVFMKWANQKHVTVPQLLLEHYTDLGMNEQEFAALLHVQFFLDSGDAFPTPQHLSERMTLTLDGCAQLLGSLVKKQLLALENKWDHNGILYEYYTLEPLWATLIQLLERKEQNAEEKKNESNEGELYQRFEQEFARPLSPIEAETLSMWLDQDGHSTELIYAALREAVVSGKLNFRYIDRILFEWKRNGIQTVEQAKNHSDRFRKRTPKKETPSKKPDQTVPSFHWLENL
ncbi:DnaD domain-containing protein [Shouchella shacheensis]|uniref:DnaD domain-containing protein n=1 Tax=Shouchella shacheensis TaxID=1649580 RepID=UPI000ABCF8DB